MPSSPKSYALPYARYPSPFATRRSTLSLLLLSALLILFLFAVVSLIAQIRHNRCINVHPRSVRVVWEHAANANANAAVGVGDGERHKVMGFVGIQTGFGSAGRREALRKTWFPSDHQGLQRLAFFKAAYALFDADFYVKADDDIYLRPDRLSLLLAKERSHPQTYIGCMKKGPVFTDPKLKWYEPLSNLLGKEYFLHAYGPIYALSTDVVSSLVALRNDSFRMFSNEDVTIGAWMLAMNVNHENNHELCATDCTATSVAVWDIPKCSGLCNPEKKMLELHQKEACFKTPTLESDDK
ncbi:probable beta-1,3-galactosyltransferase 14 isoform X2 [Phaseolus vulgaris]|uniref:probable beta-1,3-galactosyltransferase 14 isoform X2 n=1 Tax=Phaseolus vulgaris TaxID=3885 RepID=UPI0035CBD6DA